MLGHLAQHSNTHVSVVTHNITVSMHTLLPFPGHMLCRKYEDHVVLLYVYKFDTCDLIFPQAFCFEHFS